MVILLVLVVLVFLGQGKPSAAPNGPQGGARPTYGQRPVGATFADFGPVVPQLGAFYAVAKPIANNITTPIIHDVNKAVGGASPYGALRPNGDGTYTDGLGAKVTPQPDGTVKRDYGSFSQQWQRSNVHGAFVKVGHAAESATKAVGHFFSSIF